MGVAATSGTPAGRQFAEAVTIAVGRAAAAVGQIVAVRVSTELLVPAQMAGVAEIGSVAYFCLMLVSPVGQYVIRGFGEWREEGVLKTYVRRYAAYAMGVAILAGVVGALLQSKLGIVSGFTPLMVGALLALYVVATPLNTLGTSGANLMRKRIRCAVFSNVPVWAGLLISIAVLRATSAGAAGWVAGQYLGLAISSFSFFVLWRALGRPRRSHDSTGTLSFTRRAVFAFAWPVIVTNILWWIQSQGYRFVLGKAQGATSLGLFVIGYGLAAAPIALYEGIFAQIYEPEYYGNLKGQGPEGQALAWNRYARAYLPGLVIVAVFIAAGGPFLATLLVGAQFRHAAMIVVGWAAFIEMLRAASSMQSHLGIAKVDMRIVIAPVAAGAFLAPVSVLLLSRRDPLVGTALGLLTAAVAVMVIVFVISRRALPIRWPLRRCLEAAFAAAPMALALYAASREWRSPSAFRALIVVVASGAYTLAVIGFFYLFRERRLMTGRVLV